MKVTNLIGIISGLALSSTLSPLVICFLFASYLFVTLYLDPPSTLFFILPLVTCFFCLNIICLYFCILIFYLNLIYLYLCTLIPDSFLGSALPLVPCILFESHLFTTLYIDLIYLSR